MGQVKRYTGFKRRKERVRHDNIISYMQYILRHDAYRKENPLPRGRKKKVWKEPDWTEKHYRKGTKKYRSQQRRLMRLKRNREIRRVEELLRTLA